MALQPGNATEPSSAPPKAAEPAGAPANSAEKGLDSFTITWLNNTEYPYNVTRTSSDCQTTTFKASFTHTARR